MEKNKLTHLIYSLFMISTIYSQEISGYYEGEIYQKNFGNDSTTYESFEFHMKIEQFENRLKATTSVVDTKGDSATMIAYGSTVNNKIYLKEKYIAFKRSPIENKWCLKHFTLNLNTRKESISGKWFGEIDNEDYICSDGFVKIQKYEGLEQTGKVQKRFTTTEKTLTLFLWDERQSDGDRVTIYLNNKIILHNFQVSHEQKKIKVKLDHSLPKNKIIFKAENLGTIPPNTATLKIKVGKTVKKLSNESHS